MAVSGFRVPDVIERASLSCQNGGNSVCEHFFEETRKTNGRPQQDFRLSRLAGYLVAMNGDPRKVEIASAQAYFAVKAREAEVMIPALSEELELAKIKLELERERNKGKELDSTMIQLHGERVVLALRGLSNQVIEKETIITEVVEPDTGTVTKILTADQLKKAIKDRTGQKLKSLKDFTDTLRKAGRDDLLIPVKRSQVSEYPIPDKLDEAIAVVYGKARQKLIGE